MKIYNSDKMNTLNHSIDVSAEFGNSIPLIEPKNIIRSISNINGNESLNKNYEELLIRTID